MSVVQQVRDKLKRIPRREAFNAKSFEGLGSRAAIDQTLSRMVKRGEILRLIRGYYGRPRIGKFFKKWPLVPGASDVLDLMIKQRKLRVQMHGGAAVNRLGFSTQMPVMEVYYTSGPSREIIIKKDRVRLFHTSNERLLQCEGTAAGVAISGLWYLHKYEKITGETVATACERLRDEDIQKFCRCEMPRWMRDAVNEYMNSVSKNAV